MPVLHFPYCGKSSGTRVRFKSVKTILLLAQVEGGEIGDVGARARKKAQKNRPGRVGSFGG